MAATIDDRVTELERANAQLRRQLDACSTELNEAREQQTATAEVLQVINASPGDLAPVFDAMLDKAIHLCDAAFGTFWTREGESFRAVALHRVPAAFADLLAKAPYRPEPGSHHERLMQGEPFSQTVDVAAETRIGPVRQALVEQGGARSVIAVPLRKDGVVLGVISAYRQEVRPFTDKQIALLQNFAAQAVIAMENARLMTETREALEQQTATAEVLQVINSSPGDLAPVFDAIVERALRLCGGMLGYLNTWDGENIHRVAMRGLSAELMEALPRTYVPSPGSLAERIVRGESVISIADITDEAYRNSPNLQTLGRFGARSYVAVALRKDDKFLGNLSVYHEEMRAFSDKEIALLQNFAAQAVIAIENARLLTETREALEQQTATAEVLQVINSSPGDLAPVFDAVLDKATRFCAAAFGTLWTYDGDSFNAVALQQVPEAYAEFLSQAPLRPVPFSGLGRVAAGESVAHFVDVAANEAYGGGDPALRALLELGKARSTVAVPLRKDNTVLGAITAYRQEVRPFSDKQIALLQNFAAQAVIAMENARLITETREALEQQTATAEVLGVINSSPGDLAPVFDAMLGKALGLCGAAFGVFWTYDGERVHAAALRGVPPAFAEFLTRAPHRVGSDGAQGRLLRGEPVVHIRNIAEDKAYWSGDPIRRALVELGGGRTLLGVPLSKDDTFLGDFIIYRQEVRPFTDKQIALLQNFAAQAVIAMENARLITETREALEQQTATAEVLQVINSSPGDLTPVFDAMLEKATRLCEAAHGQLATFDGKFFRFVAVHGDAGFVEGQQALGLLEPSYGVTWPRIVAGEHCVHIPDVRDTELFRAGHDSARRFAGVGRGRSLLTVALRKDQTLLGTLTVYRQEVRPFSEKEIALVENFAAQAVIAMENARLLTETREALEQQTATAEVLQVINSSPGDLAPVFDAMLERATRLCGAAYGHLWTYDGEFLHPFVSRGQRDIAAWFHRAGPRRPSPDEPLGRVLAGEHFVQITDALTEEGYKVVPEIYEQLRLNKIRTILLIPLRKEDVALGVFVVYRQEVRSFTGKQIALLQNFAAQAVIAMENARLLTETREALEQQTATAEVLQVINSSPGDLAPVFDALLEKAMRLCGAVYGALTSYDGEHFRSVANHNLPEPLFEVLSQPRRAGPNSPQERLLRGERIVQIADMTEIWRSQDNPIARTAAEIGFERTVLFVPLHKDKRLLGYITAARREVRSFSEKEIALLQNFAAQAVIAMENARLITETREALEQQTATTEVLQVINSSPGDLAPVFDAMIRKAVRLCGAVQGSLRTFDGEALHLAAWHGDPSFAERARELGPIVLRPGHPMEPLLRGQRIVHLTDAREATANSEDSAVRKRVAAGNIRSWLAVALRTDGGLLGSIAVSRQEVRPFTDKQIALLQNFAAQAVIAMENARLLTETREALEQQTATAEVLQVINSSPGDLAPVFDAMLEKAHALCDAPCGSLQIFDGELFRAVTTRGLPEAYATILRRGVRSTGVDPGAIVQSDYAERLARSPDNQNARIAVEVAKLRTVLFVPLRKDDVLVGRIAAGRQEARPFTDKQIALLQNFAAQAVIAMENARLLTETREALEQQTATAEVLQVINSSPGDLSPVFDAMLDKAMRLCNAAFGYLMTYDGERFQEVAHQGLPPRFAEYLPRMDQPGSSGAYARIKGGARLVHIADLMEGDVYRTSPLRQALVDLGGARTGIVIALRKDETLLGVLTIYRQEVRPFSEKQIALLQNFAAQAVIAMENARLITETREALEQQTATADVLQVINSSPGDLAPVFDAMLEKAMRLCEADVGNFWTYDGEAFTAVAMRDPRPEQVEWARQRRRGGPGSISDSLIRGESVIHIPDAADTDAYRAGEPTRRAIVDLNGGRTLLAVALRKGDELLGYITIFRRVVRPFSDKQIALLQNFAAQAVIAMENARLITETREALEQQTATAEVLQVINSSPGDLAPVFEAMLDRAMRLCGVDHAALELYDGERMHAVAVHGASGKFAETLRQGYPATESPASRTLLEGGGFVEIADAAQIDHVAFRTAAAVDGIRTVLFVPLQRDDVFLGMIASARREVRPFSKKEIALLQNFAAQAVIAMENARLITETREALEQQTATAEVLQVINSSPGDLAPVFEAMLDKAVRLCDFAFAALWTYDGTAFHPVALHGMPAAFEAYLREHTPPAFKLLHDSAGPIHFPDVMATEMPQRDPEFARVAQQLGSVRTLLLVPLRKDAGLLGAFVAYRQEVRPFSDKQIALLQNFAAQAVIAMENARLLTETREALEQQTATAEVLQVINSSPGDLAPVFDAILEKAHSLCDIAQGSLELYDGERFRAVAVRGLSDEFAEMLRQGSPASDNPATRPLIEGERFSYIADMAASDYPVERTAAATEGVRTLLCVPLRREGQLLGMIASARKEMRPFSEKEIALLENFAAQAVIAMENARLLTETREALEQQTATAELLEVINSSPGDLAPVFDAMLEKAMRLCRIALGALELHENGKFRAVAVRGVSGPLAELLRQPFEPPPESPLARLIAGEKAVQITDMSELAQLRPDDPRAQAGAQYGLHTALFVPLRKDAELLGQVVAFRQELRPFSEKEIALLENFAAQAVIAMENARLLNELRQRTRDLQESLEYQTATSDVLKVISQSGSEIEPVLETLLETAARICEADKGVITRLQNGLYRAAASFGFPAEYEDLMARSPIAPGRGSCVGRAALERRIVHIEDAATDPEFTWTESQQLGQLRTMLGVPLFREDALIGVISLARSRVEPFTEKQIALVRTFADQAVIAIENARLFNELRERTAELGRSVEELKMLGEVGRAVSSTLDLRAVLSTILTASLGMTWATAGAIFRYIRAERAFRLVEAVGWDEALLGSVGDLSIAETETVMSEAASRRTPIQLTDLAELPSTRLRDASLAAGLRSVLIVPLVGPERIFGALVLQRREAGEFPAETVRLMQTLASQSVLAIQNARLFREIADKSEQLALASEHKSQFLANMSHELRTPLNAILGYAELLVDGIYGVLPEKAQGVLERVQNNGKHLLALINDVLDLAKIEAGQLALTLEDYVLAEVVRSVVTATEPLAAAKGLKFTAIVQDGMPMAHGDARRVSQVLLNLAGNAIKFTDAGEVEINASAANGQFLLTVRDTGPGIADADQERIFGEFQQIENTDTRKKGGTGLGLAISKRMVEMQGGMISVESTLGRGSTFRVVLPVQVEPAMEEAAE